MNTSVTGVILAGGRGERMGNVDKGLQLLGGRCLIDWVLERFEPQVDDVLISANQNLERYLEFGYPVLSDRITGFAGPLAGLHAALTQARSAFIATVPCDSPGLPLDLVSRLLAVLESSSSDMAVATMKDRRQSVFCVCRVSLLSSLQDFLEGGGRKVELWQASCRVIEVSFDDQPGTFHNLNTLDELRALKWSAERSP